jgi:hypothetical protein
MNRTVIIPVLMAAVLTCATYFVSERPARHRIQALQAELTGEEAKVEGYRRELTGLQALIVRQKEDIVRRTADHMGSAAIDRVSVLYRLLDSLGRQDGLRVEEITPSIEETVRYFTGGGDGSGNRIVPIQMSVRGGYRSLANLAAAVEKNRYWDHLLALLVAGAPDLSPDCRMTISFAADLNRQQETTGNE